MPLPLLLQTRRKVKRVCSHQGPCAIPPKHGQSQLISPVSSLKAPCCSASCSILSGLLSSVKVRSVCVIALLASAFFLLASSRISSSVGNDFSASITGGGCEDRWGCFSVHDSISNHSRSYRSLEVCVRVCIMRGRERKAGLGTSRLISEYRTRIVVIHQSTGETPS